MYTTTFTFAAGEFDADFHALDATIAKRARAIPGYLGEDAWENPDAGQVSNVYYWATREALQALIDDAAHRLAKQQQGRWLQGYQVVIAEIVGCYGDGRLAHPLAAVAPVALPPVSPPTASS